MHLCIFFFFLQIIFLEGADIFRFLIAFLGLFSKLLRLLLNVMEVTTEHQKLATISTNSDKRFFFLPEGQNSLQELEVSPHSGLYLLVLKNKNKNVQH